MSKSKWFWSCIWDYGSGADREACPARSRQGCATEAGAKAGYARHARVCLFKRGNHGVFGWKFPKGHIYKVDGHKLRKK